jgi:hypothetical protein
MSTATINGILIRDSINNCTVTNLLLMLIYSCLILMSSSSSTTIIDKHANIPCSALLCFVVGLPTLSFLDRTHDGFGSDSLLYLPLIPPLFSQSKILPSRTVPHINSHSGTAMRYAAYCAFPKTLLGLRCRSTIISHCDPTTGGSKLSLFVT